MYYLIPYQESVFLYVNKTLPSPNYLYLLAFNKYSILTLSRFMCSHGCLCRGRPIPSQLNNELFDWPIDKTESQSEIVFKGQLGSVLYTPRAEYCTVQ